MKIFISHAVEDREMAERLVDLLRLGAGVSHADIFFSSERGSIPNGDFFVEHLIKELNASDLIVSILSHSYFKSQFCLAEAGIAMARKTAGKAAFYSLIISPVHFPELDGVLYGVQSGNILDETALSELREVATVGIVNPPRLPTWDKKRKSFLHSAANIVGGCEAEEMSSRITLSDMCLNRDSRSTIKYQAKLQIVLTNSTAKDLDVMRAVWHSAHADVDCIGPLHDLMWQVSTKRGWQKDENSTVHVPVDAAFRTWIGLGVLVSDKEVLRRCATHQLGVLSLRLKICGHETLRDLRL